MLGSENLAFLETSCLLLLRKIKLRNKALRLLFGTGIQSKQFPNWKDENVQAFVRNGRSLFTSYFLSSSLCSY
jgi:hypothetical protein